MGTHFATSRDRGGVVLRDRGRRALGQIRTKAMGLRQRPQTVPPTPDEIQLSNSNCCSRPLDPIDRPRSLLLWGIRLARTVDKTVDSVRGVYPVWVGQ
jgi:hypothetical protein